MRSLIPPGIAVAVGGVLIGAGTQWTALTEAHIPWSAVMLGGLGALWTVGTLVVMPILAAPARQRPGAGRLTRPARTPHSPGARVGGSALVRDVAHRGGATPTRFEPGRAVIPGGTHA